MKNKEHLTRQGIEKIIAIRACLNLGLSYELKLAFPNILASKKLKIELPTSINPDWIAGFASAEGSFYIRIGNSSKYTTGFQVQLKFLLTQHVRDIELLQYIAQFFGCGSSKLRSNKEAGDFVVSKLSDLNQIIIPFFDKYRIIGEKFKDFEDFKKVTILMSNGAHLTREGLDNIIEIKFGMNKTRQT